jgi:hypothetical protein
MFKKNIKVAKVIKNPIEEEEVEEEPIVQQKIAPRQEPIKVEEKKNMALIISAELIEGMKVKTVLISDDVIGEVGESYEC